LKTGLPETQLIAPVRIPEKQGDSVAHSLRILATIYNYNHWIFGMIRDFLKGTVLEVGAGIGNITQFMLNAETLVCLEPDEGYRRYMEKRFANHLNVRTVSSRMEECPNSEVAAGSFDSVVCLNVLEHIKDDVGALMNCKGCLKPGGTIVVLVPAIPFIYGEMDRAMGHFRRYTKRSLKRAFVNAGLQPVHEIGRAHV
jgi:2-polyprenyl-3-methyl-5-hydroxy-6-metoxy-1,4-benzoquinol methylase